MRFRLAVLVVALASSAPAHALTTSVDLHTPSLRFGGLELSDVSVFYRDRGRGHETCVRARLAKARLVACGVIATTGGQVMLENGHATLVLPPQGGVAATTIDAAVSGNLSTLDLAMRGTVKAPKAMLRTRVVSAALTDLALPFAVHVANAGGDLSIDVRAASGGAARAGSPALAITEDAPLSVHVGSATLTAAGTTFSVEPIVMLHAGWPRWSAEIRWRALDLAPAIHAATGGRVEGSGSMSGRLALVGNRTDVTLADGQAIARNGTLRLADPEVRAALVAAVPEDKAAIKERISAALSDLTFSRLAITLGSDPAVQLAIAGRGNRVPQDLDLTINLRSQ